MSFWESCKLDAKYQKVYAWVFGFSLIYIASILLANVQYADDTTRTIQGYGWNHDGRLLWSWITYIVHGHSELMDISPWGQILGVAFLDYGLICWVRKHIPEASIIKSAMVAAFAYVNICLLQNVVYKYDSMGMLLGLSLVLFLYSLPDNYSKGKKAILSALIVLAIMYIYQAILGAYIALAIFEGFILVKDGASRDAFIHALVPRLVGLVIAVILWKISFICVASSYLGPYAKGHAGLVSFVTVDGLKIIYKNVLGFISIFKDYFQTIKWIEIMLMASMCIGLVRIAYTVWNENSYGKGAKAASIIFVLITPILLIAASIAPLVFLKSTVCKPRVLLSFTVFTLFQGYIIYTLSQYFSKVWIVSLLTLVITLSHAAYFGNLLNCQYKFNENIDWLIVRDINDLEQEKGIHFDKISNIGSTEIKCRELLLAKNEKPLYDKMIFRWFGKNYGNYYNHYRMRPIKGASTKKDKIKFKQPDRQTEFYKLYAVGDEIVVVFEKR